MLAPILDLLVDPVDHTRLQMSESGNSLVSESGHSYDIARSGYVTLVGGQGLKFRGDSAEMIISREAFLSRGHFSRFVEAVSENVRCALDSSQSDSPAQPALCEIGAGTGYYVAHALDSIEGSRAVGIDVSIPAAKRLSRTHPRCGAVVADVWSGVPIASEVIDVIIVAFAPRNPAEFHRILKQGGEAVFLTAEPGHLSELREPLGILDVEPGKYDRLLEQSSGLLEEIDTRTVSFTMKLDQESIAAQIGMSPSARHIPPDVLAQRIRLLPTHMNVTARGRLTRLRKV